jgi:hypothetical protein
MPLSRQTARGFCVYVVLDPLAERMDRLQSLVPLQSDPETIRFVEPPQTTEDDVAIDFEWGSNRYQPRIDFSAREASNKALGAAGERWVLAFEQGRLRMAQLAHLAGRIAHVALDSDAYGYDIASFDEDGQPIFIEVKTTNGDKLTPFYITRNELNRAAVAGSKYRIYRVFNFGVGPQVFKIQSPFEGRLKLTPQTYIAEF